MNEFNMNRLPVPTWNQCGVNSAPKAAALPAVPADDWGEVNLAFTLPAGVGEAEEDFTTFAESGMGAETDAFLLGNANVRSALTVAEGVEVNDPVQFEVTLDAAHPTALSVFSLDAKAHSSVTLVQVVRGDAENGVAASLTRVRAGEGAHVKLVQIQLLGSKVWSWAEAFPPAAPAPCWALPKVNMTWTPSILAARMPCWITTMSPSTLPRTPCARCTPLAS